MDQRDSDYRNAAEALWQLLDDIDSLSDSLKPEKNAFYEATMRHVARRHEILKSDGHNLELLPPAALKGTT